VIELSPGTVVGDYRLDALVGHGGMGAVFGATQLTLHRRVAIKIVLPDRMFDLDLRERFIREARVAAAIEHPNVVPIYDVGAVDDVLFIVMRFVEGTSLAETLRKDGPLDPERAVRIFGQVAQALDAAHDLGVVHRDVKPNNILITRHGGVEYAYLADFGLARFIAQTGLTRTGEALGTLPYMSPEQLMGQAVDARTDVYALGVVLHEMLTGQVAFPRDDAAAIMYAHLHVDPPELSSTNLSLGEAWNGIIPRALAKDPTQRFATAGALAEAARAALASGFVVESPAAHQAGPTWPARITQAFIEAAVPQMSDEELVRFVEELQRRSWTESDLQERVYPFVGALTDEQDTGEAPAAVTLYESLSKEGRSREVLSVLPGGRSNALTPAELGYLMEPDASGERLSKSSVRAAIRNVMRIEKRLLLEEQISRRVLLVDWTSYDVDGAGRYYVDDLDREALDGMSLPAGAAGSSPEASDREPLAYRHDRDGRDTVFVDRGGAVARTGAAGTRCFRDILGQFSERDALATVERAIALMPEVDSVTPNIRRPQVGKGETALVTEALLVAGDISHDRAHELAQRVYRSGKGATLDLRSEGFRPPAAA
jgi:serine/threonine protein kinase